MNRRHLQFLSLLAVFGGFVLILIDVPVPPSVDGVGYPLFLLTALFAVIVGGKSIGDQIITERDRWQPAAPESGYRVHVPGDEFANLSESDLKERLRVRVVLSLTDALDCTETEARTRVEEGTWTDDQIAAAYLGKERLQVPATTSIIGIIRPDSITELAIHRTINAIRELRTGPNDR